MDRAPEVLDQPELLPEAVTALKGQAAMLFLKFTRQQVARLQVFQFQAALLTVQVFQRLIVFPRLHIDPVTDEAAAVMAKQFVQ